MKQFIWTMTLLVVVLVGCIIYANAGQCRMNLMVVGGGVEAGVEETILLEETVEGHSDGDDSTAIGWTADGSDPGNYCEADTAQAHAGSLSLAINNDADADYHVYQAFTEQSSGTFYVDFYVRSSDVSGSYKRSIVVSDSDGFNQANDAATGFAWIGNDFDFYTASNYVDFTGYTTTSADTWYGIRFAFDVTAHTFDVYVDADLDGFDDESATNSDVAFQNNISPSRIYIRIDDSSSGYTWIDNLKVWK